MELERIGLRLFSLPFDWLISGNFQKVLELIENKFQDFLNPNFLFQEKNVNLNYYYNDKCEIHFYHDFVSDKSFEQQLIAIQEKYEKRIERFFEKIIQPTIFVRYCQGKDEIDFIRENYQYISSFFKSYNTKNEILFIIDEEIDLENNINFFYVPKGKNGDVNRKFLKDNVDLKLFLIEKACVKNSIRRKNLLRYTRKKIKKLLKKILNKIRKRKKIDGNKT